MDLMPVRCRPFTSLNCALILSLGVNAGAEGSEFGRFIKPLFSKRCIKCHGGGKKVKGKVNLKVIKSEKQFLANSKLIKDMIQAVDAHDMPPEDEPALDEKDRSHLIASLKTMLRESAIANVGKETRVRRLNRFQYNNSIVDLFALKKDIFLLPEKMMLRHTNYVTSNADKMPAVVNVSCQTLNAREGFKGLDPFPKDLRAAHGFDNQANQLTLSPLLLDSFLQLSQSLLSSPDFSPQNVGNWERFFKEPDAEANMKKETRKRLELLMMAAFRTPADRRTLTRYTDYVMSKIEKGASYLDGMKAATSAILASPLFLFRYEAKSRKLARYELASRLSYFLWGSGPDDELLQLAKRGKLSRSKDLSKTIDRMMKDRKILRFLDSFPSQWMQLENVFAATPDPKINRYYHIDPRNPASTQMVLEPLLLFDAVFVENRPVAELIAPSFSYRSDFLKTWYESDLRPPTVTKSDLEEVNRPIKEKRKDLEAVFSEKKKTLDAFLAAMPEQVKQKSTAVDLTAGQAEWEAASVELAGKSLEISNWHRIGPFKAANFDEAHNKSFVDETMVDRNQTYGKLKWKEAPKLVDGKVHGLSGNNCATYLFRSIRSPAVQVLEFSLGSDDSFKLWVNGKMIADKKVLRGVAPNQDKVTVSLTEGENTVLLKVANGGGGYGFYFKAQELVLPGPVIAALKEDAEKRTAEQKDLLTSYYYSIAPELADIRRDLNFRKIKLTREFKQAQSALNARKLKTLNGLKREVQAKFDQQMRRKLRAKAYHRVDTSDPRYGGVITSAAMLTMTSGPKRTLPISRGAWILEVILNDPPPPPPNDVPPLIDEADDKHLTVREKFAKHRENPGCAGCHSRLDPLGFALENYDITGRWRDKYPNGREVDASGKLLKKHDFAGAVEFKQSLAKEEQRFAKAFTAHLMRFALARELGPAEWLAVESVVKKTEPDNHKLKSLMREVILSDTFRR